MTPILKYIFKCEFNDNSFIIQNSDDTPQISKVGSSFIDVKNRLDDVIKFSLLDLSQTEIVSVDLIRGCFQFNNSPEFLSLDPSVQIPGDAKFKLIYFRRNRYIYPSNMVAYPEEYHIGYQFNINERAYKQTIAII